jgi:hypothetical protein
VQVTLAQSCRTGSQGLQERAAGALWGLSVSEVNRYSLLLSLLRRISAVLQIFVARCFFIRLEKAVVMK